MLEAALEFWNAIKGKVEDAIKQKTRNALRIERYDVTTPPNGSVVGVTQPFGAKELFIPYSQEVASAKVGDTVLVVWWNALSTAKAYFFGGGYDGGNGHYLGVNPVSAENDTVATWHNLGPGWAWYNSAGTLAVKPSSYGFLFNYVCDQNGNVDIFQVWHEQSNGPMWWRSGNANTIWDANSWVQLTGKLELNTTTAFDTQVDNIGTAGTYAFRIPYQAIGTPNSSYGYVGFIQKTGDNWVSVIAFTDGNDNLIYRKSKKNGVWSGWVSVALMSSAAPADTSTAAQCLTYAQNNPNTVFVWAKYAAATYTPVQTADTWLYTLYTTYTLSSSYTFFQAYNTNTGDIWTCQNDGTWVCHMEPERTNANLTAAVAVANETWTTLTTISLPGPGLYFIKALASFPSNATGRRQIALTSSSGTSGVTRYYGDNRPAISGVATICEFSGFTRISAATTYYLKAWQNSGSSMNVSQYSGVDAVRFDKRSS